MWRIGVAGCSEGPFPIAEVFVRLKERRWSGQIMVHARGVTSGWTPIEDVAEFAPLLKQLRGTYMGAASELQWRASADATERGVEHSFWTPTHESDDSQHSVGPSWHSHSIDVQEDSFGFLAPPNAPPAPRSREESSAGLDPFHSLDPIAPAKAKHAPRMAPIPPAPTPVMAPKNQEQSPPTLQAPTIAAAKVLTIPFDSTLKTRIITAPPVPMELGIHVTEEGHDAFL
jgi:hypothetical protein